MRESVGGLFLINIMVVFLVLYNGLLAIAVNYAIAFRVKNQIINLVEQYEGCSNDNGRIEEYVRGTGYNRSNSGTDKGYTISAFDITDKGTYYVVTTRIQFFFPIIRDLFHIDIKGETRIIYGVHESEEACNNI
jgi:hypothetical protein